MNKKLFYLVLISLFFVFAGGNIFAAQTSALGKKEQKNKKTQEQAVQVDEDNLFGEETVTPQEEIVDNSLIEKELEKNSVSFSGFVHNRNYYNMSRDWFEQKTGGFDKNVLQSYLLSNYSLDVRLKKGVKIFTNASLNYYPQEENTADKTEFLLQEMFIDLPIKKKVYFRIGKQTLQWGQGYFWRPTDIINLERESFLDRNKVKEGIYGLRMHIPIKTLVNLYTVLTSDKSFNIDQVGIAQKIEFLIKKTELSFSVSAKKHSYTLYGLELNTNLWGIDFHAEMAASHGSNQKKVSVKKVSLQGGSVLETPSTVQTQKKAVIQTSVGLGKGFTILGMTDRLTFHIEAYYNSDGYSDKESIFSYSPQVLAYVQQNSLYQANYSSRWYSAIFFTYRFLQSLSMSLNYIINFVDYSSIISATLSYSPLFNVDLTYSLNGFIGKENREYTSSGTALSNEFSVKVSF